MPVGPHRDTSSSCTRPFNEPESEDGGGGAGNGTRASADVPRTKRFGRRTAGTGNGRWSDFAPQTPFQRLPVVKSCQVTPQRWVSKGGMRECPLIPARQGLKWRAGRGKPEVLQEVERVRSSGLRARDRLVRCPSPTGRAHGSAAGSDLMFQGSNASYASRVVATGTASNRCRRYA